MPMKGVRFLMWSRIHGAEELIDEANFSPFLEWDLVRCGALGDGRGSGGSSAKMTVPSSCSDANGPPGSPAAWLK